MTLRKVEIMIGIDPESFMRNNQPTMDNARLIETIEIAASQVARSIEESEIYPVTISTQLVRFGSGSQSQVTNDADYNKRGVKTLEGEIITHFRESLRDMMLIVNPPIYETGTTTSQALTVSGQTVSGEGI